MKVLVACEFSGIVRDAFMRLGHKAWSCDLLPTESKSIFHLECDVREVLSWGWDLMIAHPPCTYLCASGARWWKDRQDEQAQAIKFVKDLMDAPIPKICIENPVGILSTVWRKPDQIIQPNWFGDPYKKTTCLWLKNLVKLRPTNIVEGNEQKCWKEPPSKDRWKNRSRTYKGIAEAMTQWATQQDLLL